ncbi:MAG: DUF4198 domain-containing protein [Bryobacteraceae bacterium]
MAVPRLVIAILICRVGLLAHDMWIEPADYSPEPGDMVGVKLRVGQDLLGDPLPRDPALIKQFIVVDSEGRKPVVGRTGGDPAGTMRIAAPGLHVIGYNSNPSSVELTPEKFNQYLKDEGLNVSNVTGGKVRERFTRCAKSLVQVGPATAAANDRRLGFTLELVAEKNPYTLKAGQDLPVVLTYEDRPLAGALVVALNRKNPSEKVTARSDKDGRVRLKLHPDGLWLIKAVHLVSSTVPEADWFSYWASLTFDLGPVKK